MRCHYCDHLLRAASQATMCALGARQRLKFSVDHLGLRTREWEQAELRARDLRRDLVEHQMAHLAWRAHLAPDVFPAPKLLQSAATGA